jgi:3',5'-cyclic AMP phosphodiesterase CpdA
VTVILQISDPHFGTERAAVVNALSLLVKKKKPDIAIWSGDITQRARHAQFTAAREFADKLAIPQLLAIPGNHDIPLFNLAARIFFPYASYKRAFGNDLEPIFESEELLILCLNTTRPWRHKNGEVSKRQIDRVTNKVAKANSLQLKVIVTHQPVSVELPDDDENLLIGYSRAIESWASAGADLILGGHIHRPHVHKIADYLGPSAGNLWSVQAGTAISKRTRDGIPNSINLIRYNIENGQRYCFVERWDFDLSTQYFQLTHTSSIDLTANAR